MGFFFEPPPEPKKILIPEASCSHLSYKATETHYEARGGGLLAGLRMTMTCEDCGKVRPRWPYEWGKR